MKTIYQIKPNDGNRGRFDNKFIKYFFPISVLVVVLVFSLSTAFRSFVMSATVPVFKSGNYFYEVIGWLPRIFSDKNKIIEENRLLQEQIEEMRLSLLEQDFLKKENERLYKELGLRPKGEFIATKVISKPLQIPIDSLLLDKGALQGIKIGDMVLVSERILIGKIAKVSDNSSVVALNSFSDASFAGFVERTGEPVIPKGVGGGGMRMNVPIDFEISINDKIVMEGSQSYVAAIVGAIEEDRASGFKNILMSLPVNAAEVRIVFVEPVVATE